MRRSALLAMAGLVALGTQVFAEQQFGVAVYPNAKPDAAVTRSLKEQMKVNGAAYRTADSVDAVAAFYRKQTMKEAPGGNKQSAGFMGNGVMVTIQNPWMDMSTGKMANDTLISFVKR